MQRYKKGRRYEYLTKKFLGEAGYDVIRASGSHGKWDIVAVNEDEQIILLIQVKSMSKGKMKLKRKRIKHYTATVIEELWTYSSSGRIKQEEDIKIGGTD